MNNLFPRLIFEKISYYVWRLNINCLNKEYSRRYFQTRSDRCNISGFTFSNQYNHRNLESKKNRTYGYFYEDQIEFNPCSPYLREPYTIRIYNRKFQGPIFLPPRYFFSMDPPEDIIRRYESQKSNFVIKKNMKNRRETTQNINGGAWLEKFPKKMAYCFWAKFFMYFTFLKKTADCFWAKFLMYIIIKKN